MSDPVVLLSTGDVVGPAGGVTDNSMVLFSGTSGKLIKGNNAVVTAAGLALLDDVDAGAQKVTLGLGNVDNTSDVNKPISTATQTALNLKAPLASPLFTGDPKAPTAPPGTNTTQVATTAFVQASTPLNLKTSGIAGTFSNLKASATGTNATVTVTADAICLKNSSNEQVVLNAVSVAPSLAASGANGLDTGASAVSTWYYVWVIWNGTIASGLLSLSATSPTMPVGYTHKAMISVVRSDSTANKFPISFIQVGDDWQYKPEAGSNLVGAAPLAASGTAGSVTTPTYVAVSVSNYVPQIATSVDVQISLSAANGNVIAAPSEQYTTPAAVFMRLANPAATAAANSSTRRMVLESTSIYWASNASDGGLYISGFKLGL